MAMQAHQLEHPLPLHRTIFFCFHNLPAKPQQHLHMQVTKRTLRSWCPQPLVPSTCEKHMDGCCQTLLYTPASLYCYGCTSCCCKGPLLNLYLGQNPNSHQNLTYFFLPLSHCMPLGRTPAPQVSSKTFPFSPALVW